MSGSLSGSLEELLKGLFDYAGMFPPASLSFEDTLKNSASFPKTLRRPGLLGSDLVLNVERLPELTPGALARAGFDRSPPRLSLLGPPLSSSSNGTAGARARTTEEFSIVSYEVKLHWPFPGFPDSAAAALRDLRGGLDEDIRLFVEPELDPSQWGSNQEAIFSLLDNLNRANTRPIGLKIRGSGPKAISNAVLSALLPEINMRNLPFKATGGLHHPLRNKFGGNELGFLNLAAALRLQSALGSMNLPNERLLECLESEDSRHYRFREGLCWKEFSIPPQALKAAISSVPFTIGSCSLSEPDEDLHRLFS